MSLYRIPVSYILVVKVLHSNVLKRLNLVLKVSEVLRSFKAVSCENLSLIQLIKTNKITKRLESTTNKSATNSSIPENKKNENPKGLFTKLKYYFKKYWYIAIPIHIVGCALWFITFYLVVRRLILFSGIITFFSGVDVVAILEYLNLPDSWVNKVKNTPPSASYLVAAMLLYKVNFISSI